MEPTIFVNCSIYLKQLFPIFFSGQRLSSSRFENLIKVLDPHPGKNAHILTDPMHRPQGQQSLIWHQARNFLSLCLWCALWRCARICCSHWNMCIQYIHTWMTFSPLEWINEIKWRHAIKSQMWECLYYY